MAGSEGQIKHVSRLLAAQMTSVGIGPGVKEVKDKRTKLPLPRPDSDEEDESKSQDVNKVSNSSGKSPDLNFALFLTDTRWRSPILENI